MVLLLALLRARDIAAEPVLVNLNATYRLSGPPTMTAFNHLIAYLPEWGLYADTTAGAPFGTMLSVTYGKPILHVRPDGAEPTRSPVMPPGLAVTRLRTTMRLDPDGRIPGESVTETAGPPVAALRRLAASAMATGTDRAAAAWLRNTGQTGTGTIEPAPLEPPGPTYSMTARFALEPRPGLPEGDAFALPAGIRVLAAPGDGLLGPISLRGLPASEPTPCYAGEQVEESSLALPPDLRPTRLPRARTIEHESFTYESRWSFEDGAIIVRRRLVSRVATPLCEGPLRVAAARLLEEVRRDHDARIELEAVP